LDMYKGLFDHAEKSLLETNAAPDGSGIDFVTKSGAVVSRVAWASAFAVAADLYWIYGKDKFNRSIYRSGAQRNIQEIGRVVFGATVAENTRSLKSPSKAWIGIKAAAKVAAVGVTVTYGLPVAAAWAAAWLPAMLTTGAVPTFMGTAAAWTAGVGGVGLTALSATRSAFAEHHQQHELRRRVEAALASSTEQLGGKHAQVLKYLSDEWARETVAGAGEAAGGGMEKLTSIKASLQAAMKRRDYMLRATRDSLCVALETTTFDSLREMEKKKSAHQRAAFAEQKEAEPVNTKTWIWDLASQLGCTVVATAGKMFRGAVSAVDWTRRAKQLLYSAVARCRRILASGLHHLFAAASAGVAIGAAVITALWRPIGNFIAWLYGTVWRDALLIIGRSMPYETDLRFWNMIVQMLDFDLWNRVFDNAPILGIENDRLQRLVEACTASAEVLPNKREWKNLAARGVSMLRTKYPAGFVGVQNDEKHYWVSLLHRSAVHDALWKGFESTKGRNGVMAWLARAESIREIKTNAHAACVLSALMHLGALLQLRFGYPAGTFFVEENALFKAAQDLLHLALPDFENAPLDALCLFFGLSMTDRANASAAYSQWFNYTAVAGLDATSLLNPDEELAQTQIRACLDAYGVTPCAGVWKLAGLFATNPDAGWMDTVPPIMPLYFGRADRSFVGEARVPDDPLPGGPDAADRVLTPESNLMGEILAVAGAAGAPAPRGRSVQAQLTAAGTLAGTGAAGATGPQTRWVQYRLAAAGTVLRVQITYSAARGVIAESYEHGVLTSPVTRQLARAFRAQLQKSAMMFGVQQAAAQ
jgi:hypothetical protein